MVENTSKPNPLMHLFGSSIEGQERYITDMEADGQRQFIDSGLFPVEGSGDDELRALGFTIGDPDPADPLFRPATLPDGWSRRATGHSQASDIVDRFGRTRVTVFYKAAFYDRRASYTVCSVAAYVESLVNTDPMPLPVVDEWATRDALTQAIADGTYNALQRATRYQGSSPDLADHYRREAWRYDQLLAAVQASQPSRGRNW